MPGRLAATARAARLPGVRDYLSGAAVGGIAAVSGVSPHKY
jgi:hypothetical protein